MELDDFLSDVLETAGRPVDLRDYKQGKLLRSYKRRRRQYRIGIDLNSLVHKAAKFFGDMIIDERPVREYGTRGATLRKNAENINEYQYITQCAEFIMKRLERLRKDSDCEVLVVFNGQSLPIETNKAIWLRGIRTVYEGVRKDANVQLGAEKHFDQIILTLVDRLKESQFVYLIAPYEASSQLAFMSSRGHIDLIISEDPNLMAYGAKGVVYNYISGDGFPDEGRLLQFEDIGTVKGKFDLSDFSPVMIAVLIVSIGCADYFEITLGGIGLSTAVNIVREAFLGGYASPLHTILTKLHAKFWKRDLNDDAKGVCEHRFIEGVFMFQHPIVFDRVQGKALIQGQKEMAAQSTLTMHEGYAKLCRDEEERSQAIGIVPETAMMAIAAATPLLARQTRYSRNATALSDMSNNGTDLRSSARFQVGSNTSSPGYRQTDEKVELLKHDSSTEDQSAASDPIMDFKSDSSSSCPDGQIQAFVASVPTSFLNGGVKQKDDSAPMSDGTEIEIVARVVFGTTNEEVVKLTFLTSDSDMDSSQSDWSPARYQVGSKASSRRATQDQSDSTALHAKVEIQTLVARVPASLLTTEVKQKGETEIKVRVVFETTNKEATKMAVASDTSDDDCPIALRRIFESDFKARDRTYSAKYLKRTAETVWRRAPKHVKQSLPSEGCGNEELVRWKLKYFGEQTPRPVFVGSCPELLIDMLRGDVVRKTKFSQKELSRCIHKIWKCISADAKACLPREGFPEYLSELKKWKELHVPDAAEMMAMPFKPSVQ
ncbi:unnamed protein product [Cylindrotheca closterium]|uniref:XPG-I domain-containing protein n=1 Tax=Cylindrotheca closterium TaxID=2856 RepID=A0AAD2G667_9STRA|nr:unnamed protein product [Cylindrotheca closterium]